MSADLEVEGRPPAASTEETLLGYASRSDNGLLDRALRRLELFLSILGFQQSTSVLSLILHCCIFLVLGMVVPVASIYLSRCLDGGCKTYEVRKFELLVVASEVSLALVSVVCVSMDLCKCGLRRFLFVDHDRGKMEKFRDQYIEKIQLDFFGVFLLRFLPCLALKILWEIVRSLHACQDSLWLSIGTLAASIIGWSYLTAIFLSACILFNLVCNLQVIHFEDFGMLFERERDVTHILEEHVCLRHCLSSTSHRFRMYLLLIFIGVSVSQVVTLFMITGYGGLVNIKNAGGFAVSSVVQIVGITMCLHSAAKISHKAQAISALASKWHAMLTCTNSDPLDARMVSNRFGNSRAALPAMPVRNYSENDLESLDNAVVQAVSQISFYMSSHNKRQSLVTYLQGNPGGITIFGWTVDRALITTMFFIELSLVLFVLGKTLVFSSKLSDLDIL